VIHTTVPVEVRELFEQTPEVKQYFGGFHPKWIPKWAPELQEYLHPNLEVKTGINLSLASFVNGYSLGKGDSNELPA
jgi:hypothetical protein